MKPVYLKLGIRVFGTLVGLMGIFGVYFALVVFLPHAIRADGGFGAVFFVLPLLISVYELYVGYLVWFRWSPLAVRHVAGVLIFLIWTLVARYTFHRPSASAPDWTLMLPMVGLLVLYAGYRWLTTYWSRRLFPSAVADVGALSGHPADPS